MEAVDYKLGGYTKNTFAMTMWYGMEKITYEGQREVNTPPIKEIIK